MENLFDSQFDSQFKKIQTLHWLPWVGKDYIKTPQEKRLLIVGDSHYVPEGESQEDGYNDKKWTREFIIKEGLKQPPLYMGNSINPLIANTERAIFNTRNLTDENKKKLWLSSAFFNLVQRLLSSRDNTNRPHDEDFDAGWQSFFEIVQILKPRYVVKCGIDGFGRLGALMANNKEWEHDVEEFKKRPRVINLIKDGYKLRVLFINHPSHHFSWTSWANCLNEHLNEYTSWIQK